MSFTLEKKDLVDIFQKAYPLVPQRSSLQILSNIKMSFSPDKLIVTSTDLDQSINVEVSLISGEGDYEITVNARKIFDIIRELYDGPVSMDIEEDIITINSGEFHCKIAGSDSRDFPVFPELKDFIEIEIPFRYLKNLVKKTSFAVSKDEVKACLCGILWEIEKNRTGMVATDGHRLGSSFIEYNIDVNENIQSIVSSKTLTHLSRIIDDSEKENLTIKVLIDENYIMFIDDNIKLCSKLIDGPYPDYDKVIPKSNPKKVEVEKSELLNAVKRVSVLSNQKTHLVKFIFRNNELEIVAFNRDIGGEAKQKLEVEYEGEEHKIGFNASYLSEIISLIQTDKVRFEMNTHISACMIFPAYKEDDSRDSEDKFLIMPLRIIDEE